MAQQIKKKFLDPEVISYFDDQIVTEKERIDAILNAADADKDTFVEIVQLINSIDTENDQAFAGYVLSNNERVTDLENRLDDSENNIESLQEKDIDLEQRLVKEENVNKFLTASFYNDSAAVFADAEKGVEDPSSLTRDGWYFENLSAGKKINWYFYDGTQQVVTLGSFSAYAIMTFDAINPPILAFYTVPTGTNDVIPGFAHSRVVYSAMAPTPVVGKKYLVYFGENPDVHPNLPRIQLLKSTTISAGEQLPGEIVLTSSFGSNSSATVGSVKFMVESLGVYSPNFKSIINLKIKNVSKDQYNEEVNEIQSDLAALESKTLSLENFGYDQIVHVSKNGLDTNTGKQHFPFLTITAALNSISDASPTKRYAVKVAPGNYSEAIALKANVFVIGEGQKESIRITGAISLHSSFTGTSDHRSGFSQVTLLSAADFNWATVTSGAGKLYFNETVFGSTVNMYGHNNAIAQSQFNSCIIFGNLTISGINVGAFTNNVCFGNITLNQHPNGGMATLLNATGGYCNVLTQNATVNDFNRRSASFLRNFNSEKLVLNGPSVYADVDLVSQGKQLPEIIDGANLVAFNPRVNHDITTQMIVPKNTNSHNMGDWGKQWFWNFGYVHASSGTDLYLISYPDTFAPDSSGKSIGIYTDGAGLQENVDGGSIELATEQTSGTGVRGIVKLDGRHIDLSNKQIKNLADAIDDSDAVNKAQLDKEVSDLNERIDTISASSFGKGSVLVGAELAYVDLDREYAVVLSVTVGRLAVHEGEDYTVSVFGGVTRLTWIGSLANPDGEEKIETGDKIFYTGTY